jgi:hypothetical protein
MAGNTAKSRLIQIAEHLQQHGVEFMVIDGQAALVQLEALQRLCEGK